MSHAKKIELQQKLGQAVKQYRDFIESPDYEAADGEARATQMDNEIKSIENRIAQIKALEEKEQRYAQARVDAQGQGQQGEGDDANATYRAAFRSYLSRGNSITAENRQILESRAAQSSLVGEDGGFTVPVELAQEIEKFLKAYGGIYDISRVITTASGNRINWPTGNNTGRKGYIVGQNVPAGDATKVAFGSIPLDSHKYTSGELLIPRELIEDSDFNIEAYIAEEIAESVGRAIAEDMAIGSGTNKPQGVVVGASSGITGVPTGITFDHMIDLQHSVNSAYRANARYVFNDDTLKVLRKVKGTDGHYIWTMGDARTGAPSLVAGMPYTISDDMPSIAASAKPIVFGDFSKYLVRSVGEGRLLRSAELNMVSDQITLVYFRRVDARVVNNQALKFLQIAGA